MKFISTNNALKPSGHYSQAIVHNDLVFISGQLSIDPETGEKKFGTIEDETDRILKNIELILKEAGSDKNHILKTTIYIPDISLWDKVNKVYSDFFENHKPTRSVVPTKDLHFGFKVEIEVIATIIEK
ncbi:Rid family detoxifying hydrolase [Clostridium aestuarii]|uniref:Rid family detoxifying hydrolase n=1 Tax=Clostridium aestuarii TaxID=338193 RepID=A0ABT4D1B7_9CLOT|nr:Rid family detoxifying hydrolase [Clostridium aestuarii]MCY6485038.1 Rid family detoxifying hydrolase [Clostridium aestuarii]